MASSSERSALLFTCEHGGNAIPAEYGPLFASEEAKSALDSHRGWDPGALDLARYLAKAFRAPLFYSTVSRLVADLNRSEHHPSLFSRWSGNLSPDEKEAILDRYYRPHRNRVMDEIRSLLAGTASGREPHAKFARKSARATSVIHIAIHSFTPVLQGVRRNAEIGILYDPARKREREFAMNWQEALRGDGIGAHSIRIRRNYPYRGTADGFPTALRRIFPDPLYAGFELECNQEFLEKDAELARNLLRESLHRILS